jgi:predicted alpha/beta hydrolase family esterase
MPKENIILISGGLTFKNEEQMLAYYRTWDIDKNYDGKYWMDWLMWSLGDTYNFVKPNFPGKDHAHYGVWKIVFEKHLERVGRENVSLICHSLGTIFILKYLTENSLKIKNLHLVGTYVADEFQKENDTESAGTFAFDITHVKDMSGNCEKIYLWHSEDDTDCSIQNAEYVHEQLPDAVFSKFADRGHFVGATFLELFDVLRKNDFVIKR